MDKDFVNKNIVAIQKEINKKILDRVYILEKLEKIKQEVLNYD